MTNAVAMPGAPCIFAVYVGIIVAGATAMSNMGLRRPVLKREDSLLLDASQRCAYVKPYAGGEERKAVEPHRLHQLGTAQLRRPQNRMYHSVAPIETAEEHVIQ
jgi:hypothetical protein